MRWLKIGLAYAVPVLLLFLLDNFPDIARENRFLRGINLNAFLFQKATTSGFKKPRNNYVVLVLLDDKVPQAIRNNLCLQRKYLGELVSRIRDAAPAAIALDFLFGKDTCPETEPSLYEGTVELQHAISDVSASIPVIIAQKTTDAAYLLKTSPKMLTRLRGLGFKDNQAILEPSLKLDSTDTLKLSYGLFTFNEDSRKVPLSWSAYTSLDRVGQEPPVKMDTFSVAVAKAYRPDPRILSEIKSFQASGRDPLTSFLTEREIRCFSSSDVLEGSTHQSIGQEKCNSPDVETPPLAQLNHRVVVIGKDDIRIDRHDSVIGEVSGVVLQANYIESILDSRLLKPVHGWLSISIAVAWLGLTELLFRLLPGHPHRALALALAATVVVWIFLYDLFLMQWGYYLVLWPPSIIAIFIRYVLVVFEHPNRKDIK
jgi:CHASE2 domain-containing sensor protein